MRYLSRALAALLLIVLIAAATGAAPSAIATHLAAPQARHSIIFPSGGLNYSPADLTVFVGDEVEWSGPFAFHPLVSEDALWPVVSTGDSFRFTFTLPGVYRYYCQAHGAPGGVGMSGVVRVRTPVRTYVPLIQK